MKSVIVNSNQKVGKCQNTKRKEKNKLWQSKILEPSTELGLNPSDMFIFSLLILLAILTLASVFRLILHIDC